MEFSVEVDMLSQVRFYALSSALLGSFMCDWKGRLEYSEVLVAFIDVFVEYVPHVIYLGLVCVVLFEWSLQMFDLGVLPWYYKMSYSI